MEAELIFAFGESNKNGLALHCRGTNGGTRQMRLS
jgi:hypothetical protein